MNCRGIIIIELNLVMKYMTWRYPTNEIQISNYSVEETIKMPQTLAIQIESENN